MRAWARPLDLLDAAYRLDGTEDDWLQGLAEKLYEISAGRAQATGALRLRGRVDPGGRTVIASVGSPKVVNTEAGRRPEILDGIFGYPDHLEPELQERVFFSSCTAGTASIVTGLGEQLDGDPIWQHSGFQRMPVRDALYLSGHDGPLGSVALFETLPEITALQPAEQRLGQRMAAHIGAAFRLRNRREATPDGAEAVLSPAGTVQHLARDADRAAVEDGFARRRHARRRGAAPESALEVWQGLHDGRWSLVDYVDNDRKAFVLAVRNDPARDVPSALTDRQRAALSLAALGYGNKQIAYALGLSATAVAMLLARARAATGCRTRADLVRSFKRNLTGPG